METPIIYVPDVESEFVIPTQGIPPVDLRPTGDARLDALAMGVTGDLVAEFVVMRDRMRTRTDQAHLAGDNVEKLRQFIDTTGGDKWNILSYYLDGVEAFREVGGFTARLIAGEEPDLCHRMCATGWTIHRLPYEMTIHDASMTRIAQWWQRNRRSGYATAEALALRGWSEPRTLREVLSNIFWASPLGWPLWPLLWWKTRRHRGALYATFVMMGKIPHLQGQFDYWMRRRQIIEYK